MSIGGFIAGLLVALLSGLVARTTQLREDASFAAFYLISLALGVLIVSTRGSNIDLMHVLFGTILAVDDRSLILVSGIATVSVAVLAVIYRPLLVECFDPGFLRSVGGQGGMYHILFLVLVVLNLVAGFQALGTLMAVGLMMLPAAAARFWSASVWSLAAVSAFIALLSGYVGLLLSFHADLPSGPSIVLTAGVIYVVSMVAGAQGSLRQTLIARPHYES
jgi:zinc/manganese transport system permease protein